MSKFTPPNYDTHPDGSRIPDENGKVACHCGRKVWPFVLIDVRHLDNVDHDWACDACWTDWQRTRLPVMKAHGNYDKYKVEQFDKGNPAHIADPKVFHAAQAKARSDGSKAWLGNWLAAHGAPQTIINKMKQTNRRA